MAVEVVDSPKIASLRPTLDSDSVLFCPRANTFLFSGYPVFLYLYKYLLFRVVYLTV